MLLTLKKNWIFFCWTVAEFLYGDCGRSCDCCELCFVCRRWLSLLSLFLSSCTRKKKRVCDDGDDLRSCLAQLYGWPFNHIQQTTLWWPQHKQLKFWMEKKIFPAANTTVSGLVGIKQRISPSFNGLFQACSIYIRACIYVWWFIQFLIQISTMMNVVGNWIFIQKLKKIEFELNQRKKMAILWWMGGWMDAKNERFKLLHTILICL